MQFIIKTITDRIAQLERQRADIIQQLGQLHWEDDAISTQILQADLDHIEAQLPIASMVNCTPHQINIEGLGELPPSGILPRVESHFRDCFPLHGVRVTYKVGAGVVVGLPDPVEGLSFIVSGMVRDALRGLPEPLQRPDVFAPDTGPDAIRNALGGIIAVRGLIQ